MDDLERIRQQRLRELQERQAQAQQQEAQAAEQQAQQEAASERVLAQVLDGDAMARLTNIRLARPEFAQQVTRQLVALAQSGRLTRRLGDAELRAILQQLTPKDRDINITRK